MRLINSAIRNHKSLRMLNEAERFHFLISLIIFVFIAYWAIWYVPMNNDEANNYHILACLYNTNSYISSAGAEFQECPSRFDFLTIFGFTLHRSNAYYGLFAPALYAPIFFLFHFPSAEYGFGLACFLLFCTLMSRLTRKPQVSFPVFLSFFPLIFNFIHDMGPVHNALLMFPLSVLILRYIVSSRSYLAYVFAALLAFLIVAEIEEKAFFFYLMPGLAFFMLAFLRENLCELLKAAWRPMMFGAVICFGLALALMLSTKVAAPYQGLTFAGWLYLLVTSKDLTAYVTPLYDMATLSMAEKWFRFLFFWPHYAGRFFMIDLVANGQVTISFTNLLLVCLSPCLLFATIITGYSTQIWKKIVIVPLHRTVLLVLSFLSFVVTFSIVGGVWAGHHFVFIWLPILILLCDLLANFSGNMLLGASLLLAVGNMVPVLWLYQADLHYEVSRERDAIGTYFTPERAAHAIIGYQNWGYHFIQRDYGPKDQMVFVNSMNTEKTANEVNTLLNNLNRELYWVCRNADPTNTAEAILINKCSQPVVEAEFRCEMHRNATAVNLLPNLKVWHLYKIVFKDQKQVPQSGLNCVTHF